MKTENKLIAEFMGAQILSPNTKYSMVQYPLDVTTKTPFQHRETYKQLIHSKDLEYDSNWSWLMPVVEKIESLKAKSGKNYQVTIKSDTCSITDPEFFMKGAEYYSLFEVARIGVDNKIDTCYLTIIQFITWYNQQQPC